MIVLLFDTYLLMIYGYLGYIFFFGRKKLSNDLYCDCRVGLAFLADDGAFFCYYLLFYFYFIY